MNAFLFVPLLAATWAVGTFLVLYLSHVFYTVVTETSAGNDEVRFPAESPIDWMWKGFYVALLVFTWGAPGVVLGILAARGADPAKLLYAGSAFALLFPLGVLCTLANRSHWMPVSFPLFYRLGQKLPSLIGFYILGVVPLAGFIAWLALGMGRETAVPMVILYSILGAAGWILYARLLGRLGLLLSFTYGFREIAEPKPKARPRRREPVGEDEAPVFIQPSELAPVPTPDGFLTGYNVGTQEPVLPPAAVRPRPNVFDPDEDSTPMEIAAEDRDLDRRDRQGHQRVEYKVTEAEIQMYSKKRRVQEPKTAYDAKVFSILVQGEMLKTMVILALGMGLLGCMAQGLRALNPMRG